METIITRFAPSPTGHLHIGGARTALYNYLFSRKSSGYARLRIEDTDLERSNEAFTHEIISSLKWLGMNFDKEIVYQSKRHDLYRQTVDYLLKNNHAYKCYCSKEELDKKREVALKNKQNPKYDRTCRELTSQKEGAFVIRFKAPLTGIITINDLIKGEVKFNLEEFDDFIIQRADGSFTYNFVVVCDDAEMGITHIIRGDDHLNNTPKQVMLYNALSKTPPKFAHLPLILGADKQRLSKRHGATSVVEYRKQGFLPEALVNFLARIGWASGDEEIFSMDDLIKKFSLENCGKSAGIFNMDKLIWLNKHYISQKPSSELLKLLRSEYDAAELPENENVIKILDLLKTRAQTLVELSKSIKPYFLEAITFDGEKIKTLKLEKNLIEPLLKETESIDTFAKEGIEQKLKIFSDKNNTKLRNVAEFIRFALSGELSGPGLFEIMVIMGKETTLSRMRTLAKQI